VRDYHVVVIVFTNIRLICFFWGLVTVFVQVFPGLFLLYFSSWVCNKFRRDNVIQSL